MTRVTHLQKILLVIVLILSFSIGAEEWWKPIGIALYVYYFTFIANLFIKLYERETFLTRAFFGITEMPLYIAMVSIALVILVLQKQYPTTNFDGSYLNAVIGGIATTIGRIKRGKIKLRESK